MLLNNSDYNIIDIRNRNSYIMGHIPGSINIDYFELLMNHQKYLKKEEKYCLYCDSGKRSLTLVNKLKSLGYNVVNLEGGYNNYLRR